MRKLTALLLALCLALPLVACGGGGKTTVAPATQPPATTTAPTTEPAAPALRTGYYVTEIMSDGTDTYDRATLEAAGIYSYILFSADGTGTMDLAGEVIDFEWDESNLYAVGEVLPYTLEGDRVSLTAEGVSVEFSFYGAQLPEAYVAESAKSGYYLLVSMTQNGETYDEAALIEAGMYAYMMFYADGTGVLSTNGELLTLTWDDAKITSSDGEEDYFTLDGDLMRFDSDGVQLVFRYNGVTLPEEYQTATAEPGQIEGYYVLSGAETEGYYLDAETLESAGMTSYIVLLENGVGYMQFNGEETVLEWDENNLYADGEPQPYTLDGDTLTLAQEELAMYYERSSEEPPAPNVELP